MKVVGLVADYDGVAGIVSALKKMVVIIVNILMMVILL
jgi:hypothetical protein